MSKTTIQTELNGEWLNVDSSFLDCYFRTSVISEVIAKFNGKKRIKVLGTHFRVA